MSHEDDNKALVRRYVDFLNQNNLSSEEVIDPGFVFHDPGLPDVKDLAGARQFIAAYNDALPEQFSTIEDIVAEGDKVVLRYSAAVRTNVISWVFRRQAKPQRALESRSTELLMAKWWKNGT